MDVNNIEKKVWAYIKANNMREDCSNAVVGVSGGADSVCLMIMLNDYIIHNNKDVKLHIVHVNHGIRKEAADDEQFTRKLCESLKLDYHCYNIECDIIIIEDKAVSVTGNEIWMTSTEIAGLFHTGVPAVNAAIRAVRKPDVLNDYEVCRYMRLENGLSADVYSLEIIIPIAFRLNTYHAHVFRTWLVGKALSKEKRQAYVMFIQNGKAGYC